MKRWLLGGLICLSLVTGIKAENPYFPIGNFIGGLNSFYSSLFIPENEVHDALNVYFDKDYAVTKREGYALYGTTITVRFYNSIAFTDSSNNNWLIAISTQGIFASPGTGVFTIQIATVPSFNTSLVACVNAFNKVYFVDNVQGVYFWNGSSTTYVGSSSSPKGSLITEFHGRLWVAGLAIPNQNQLYASEFLNGSNWTTGGTAATDPVLITVGLNDNYDGISALYPGYNDTLYVFKKLSINGVYGFDQSDFQTRTLTRDAGCIDQGSVQPFKSNLVFMSDRGVELFDGFRVQLISKKISNKIEAATFSSFSQRTWEVNESAEWEAGVYNSTSSALRDTENDRLRIRYPDNFSVYRDTNSAFPVWTNFFSGGTPATGTITSNSGKLEIFHNGGTIGNVHIQSNAILPSFAQGTTYHFRIDEVPFDATNTSSVFIALSTAVFIAPSGPIVTSTNRDWYVVLRSSASGKVFISNASNGTDGGLIPSPAVQYALPITFDFWISTSNFIYSVNGSTAHSGTHTWPNKPVYVYLGAQNFASVPRTYKIDDFQVAPLQMNFMSSTFNIGSNITSWGSFLTSEDTGNGGTISYEFCSDNNSGMTSPDCRAQTPNSQITAAVDSFARWSATFTITALSQDPILYSGITQWNEGTRRPRMASIYHNDRYFLSITTNTLSDGNDATIVLAEGLNGQLVWSMFDINSGTWVLYKNQVYHGDSNPTGKFYLDNQGFTDNGNAINAFIVTKDFAIENILAEKIYDNFILNAEGLGNYELNTSYFLDKESTQFDLSMSTQNETGNFLNIFLPFPIDDGHQVFSKVINFKFSNNQNNAPMQLYGGFLGYRKRPIIGQ